MRANGVNNALNSARAVAVGGPFNQSNTIRAASVSQSASQAADGGRALVQVQQANLSQRYTVANASSRASGHQTLRTGSSPSLDQQKTVIDIFGIYTGALGTLCLAQPVGDADERAPRLRLFRRGPSISTRRVAVGLWSNGHIRRFDASPASKITPRQRPIAPHRQGSSGMAAITSVICRHAPALSWHLSSFHVGRQPAVCHHQ